METKETIQDVLPYVVGVWRDWNNSMYIYSDFATLWRSGKRETFSLGVDWLDSHTLPINPEASADYHRHLESEKQTQRKIALEETAKALAHLGDIAREVSEYLSQAGTSESEGLYKLLTTKKFRSNFRKSLCEQVLQYFRTPKASRRFSKPLSPKQLEYLF